MTAPLDAQTFEAALQALVDRAIRDGVPADDITTALECQTMAIVDMPDDD